MTELVHIGDENNTLCGKMGEFASLGMWATCDDCLRVAQDVINKRRVGVKGE